MITVFYQRCRHFVEHKENLVWERNFLNWSVKSRQLHTSDDVGETVAFESE